MQRLVVLGVFAGAGMALFHWGEGYGVDACALAVMELGFGAWGCSSRRAAREADVARWNFKAALAWSELAESAEWKPCVDEYVRQEAREKKSKKPRARR